MTVEEIIVAKLLSDSVITDIIGDRIYAQEITQGDTVPALVYLMADETPIDSQSGICLYETKLWIQCTTKTYSEARTLQKAVVSCLDRYDNQVSGDTEIIITRYSGVVGSEKEKDTEYRNIVLDFKILNK
jgi:hypothetical protein